MISIAAILIVALTACSGGAGKSQSGGPNSSTRPSVTSIQVSAASMSIGTGGQQQFHAIAHLSDGSSQDITNSSSWSSSDGNIASVSAAGLATGSGSGGHD